MKKQFVAALLAVFVIFSVLGWGAATPAFARSPVKPGLNPDLLDSMLESASEYFTDIFDDLSKDKSFDENDESLKPASKVGLNLFQIAESADGNLFVYVSWYSNIDVEVTSINMSLSSEISTSSLYDLAKLNTYSNEVLTFGKFVVRNFVVDSDDIRFYNISSISRKWDNEIDQGVENNNKVEEVSFEVAKLFRAITVDGTVKYSVKQTEVIVVTDKYVSNIRFEHGLVIDSIFGNAKDYSTTGHYVAFSTDRRIDELLEADVSFVERDWAYSGPFWDYFKDGRELELEYGNYSDPINKTLKSTDRITASVPYFDYVYSWGTIQSVNNFIDSLQAESIVLLAKDLKNLQGKTWVLRFHETDLLETVGLFGGYTYNGTDVSSVTILRLKFQTDGITYNLGVVDNKTTGSGSNDPGNKTSADTFLERLMAFLEKLGNWIDKYWWVLVIVAGILVLSILSLCFPKVWFVVKVILKGIWIGLKWIVIGLYFVVSALPRLIVFIAIKIQERRESGGLE